MTDDEVVRKKDTGKKPATPSDVIRPIEVVDKKGKVHSRGIEPIMVQVVPKKKLTPLSEVKLSQTEQLLLRWLQQRADKEVMASGDVRIEIPYTENRANTLGTTGCFHNDAEDLLYKLHGKGVLSKRYSLEIAEEAQDGGYGVFLSEADARNIGAYPAKAKVPTR